MSKGGANVKGDPIVKVILNQILEGANVLIQI